MPTTFDISEASKGGPTPQPQPTNSGKGTGLPIDDFARTLLYISLAVTGICLIYMLWGLYGGGWANPVYGTLTHADRVRHLANIDLVGSVLRIASIIDILCLAVCCFRDEGVGYVLLGIGAVLYGGMPLLTTAIFASRGFAQSYISNHALATLNGLTGIYVVPGVCFVLADFVRRLKAMSDAAAIQRTNMRYGSDAQKQASSKRQNLFLGRCWELPYCRNEVKVKCPIYIKRRGPCWWYKEGCMCEERIVLQAMIDTDWRDKTNSAAQKLGAPPTGSNLGASASAANPGMGAGRSPSNLGMGTAAQKLGMSTPSSPMSLSPQGAAAPAGKMNLTGAASAPVHNLSSIAPGPTKHLNPAQKRERCRKCIIYNEHQRQKYKALVWVALIAVPALLFMNMTWLSGVVNGIIMTAARLSNQFTLSAGDHQAANALMDSTNQSTVTGIMVFCLGLVIVAQVLKAIEYCVFKLKI